LNSAIQTSYDEGMIPMDRALVELVRGGQVTMEDAQIYVKDLDYFSSVMNKGI
jgi:Tfp pilus assembly pilus retraction ATPase PilT